MKNYIISDKDTIAAINTLLYAEYVTEDGVNFKFPFREGTLRYLPIEGVDEDLLKIDEVRLVEYASMHSELQNYLDGQVKYSQEDLTTLGKFPIEDEGF